MSAETTAGVATGTGAWAVVELMGHVRLGGRLSEEERFGAKMGRLDIPREDGSFVTQHFGGQSVYRITYVSEAVARHVARGCSPEPVHAWDFPKAIGPAADRDDKSGGDDDDNRPF